MLWAPPSRAFLTLLAGFVVAWTAVWIFMGIWTKHEVQTLRQLSNTVIQSGGAVRGRQVSVAGVNTQRSGRSSRTAVDNLASLLGVAIALVPTIPMIALLVVTWRLARPRTQPA
jgi:hypothetical protein